MQHTVLALLIAGATIALIIFRPRGLTEGWSALLGGVATVAVGLVTPLQAAQVVRGTLQILAFFLGMMAITAMAEQAGAFVWAAETAGRLSGGSARRLFLMLFATGAVVTVFFSNDATALALTPLVLVLAERLRLAPLAYAFACAFVANTASSLLPMANPLNIIVLTSFPRSLGQFIGYLGLPTLAAVTVSYGLLAWIFRRELTGTFEISELTHAPGKASRHFRFTAAALAAIAVAYVAAAALTVPLAYVALAGGVLLIAGALLLGQLDVRQLGRQMSWSIFPFIAGMFVVIQGLEDTGWTSQLASAILSMSKQDLLAGTLGTTFLVALAANVVNNLPIAVVMISTMHQVAGPPPMLLYGTLLGADLGPCLSVTGSLAAMLWLIILRRRGLTISGWSYLKVGLVVTPVILAASAAVLWAELTLLH